MRSPCVAPAPQIIQILVISAVIHRLPEAVVQVGHQLAVTGQPDEWFLLEDQAGILGQTIEDRPVHDEEPAVDAAARDQRLLIELGHLAAFQIDFSKTAGRPDCGHGADLAVSLVELDKLG